MIIKREAGENKSTGNVDLPKSGLIRATKSREAFSPEQGPTKAEFLKVYFKRSCWLYHITLSIATYTSEAS